MSEKRKLSTVLFADIAGYTSLMQTDEQQAMLYLNQFKETIEKIVPINHGEIIQYYGDAVLLTFDSAVDGVECSMSLQVAFIEKKIPIRVGMHLGDVVFKNDNVFGDGVNIASRIESMGIPGGILVSKAIRDQLANKSEFQLMSLGNFEFKNVKEPLEVFALANEGLVVPTRADLRGKGKQAKRKRPMWQSLTAVILLMVATVVFYVFYTKNSDSKISASQPNAQEKTIALLPFRDLSSNQDQVYFADGIVEAIRSKLAQVAELQVTSMTSVMSYRGTSKPIGEISKELGVNHLMEGTVSREGNKVRVIVKLIDAVKDRHIWSETYDEEVNDIFAIQSSIANQVTTQLKANLTPQEEQRLSISLTTDISAYDLYLSALRDHKMIDADTSYLNVAYQKLQRAIETDSTYDDFYLALARNWFIKRNFGYGDKVLDSADFYLDRAISLNPYSDGAFVLKSAIAWHKADFSKSKIMAEKALSLAPNNADAIRSLALYYQQKEQDFEKAVPLVFKALAIDPKNQSDPGQYLSFFGRLYTVFLNADMTVEAKAVLQKGKQLYPNNGTVIGALALSEQIDGNFEAAVQYAKMHYELNPDRFYVIDNYAYALLLNGNYKESEKYYRKMMDIIASGYNETYSSHTFRHRLGYVLWQQGKKEEAKKMFAEHIEKEKAFLAEGTRLQAQEYDLAGAYAFIGEKELAYEWLEKMPYWQITFQYLKNDPLFDSLREEDRFKQIFSELQKKANRIRKGVEKMKIDEKLMFPVIE